MKLGTNVSEDRKKIVAMAVFVVIASGLVYFEYFDAGSPETPATTPAATAAPATEGAPAGRPGGGCGKGGEADGRRPRPRWTRGCIWKLCW